MHLITTFKIRFMGGILTVIKIISKRYKERRGYNPLGDLSDVSINASYNDHQVYIWFRGGDFNHFQYNLKVYNEEVGMVPVALNSHVGQCNVSWPFRIF